MGEIIAGSDKAEYDYHIFRYAEVLLVLAEATFEKDGRISDDLLNQTINVVRVSGRIVKPGEQVRPCCSLLS